MNDGKGGALICDYVLVPVVAAAQAALTCSR